MILGIRCSTNDFSFAVLSGSVSSPQLHMVQSISFPASYSQPEKLKWFLDELTELNRKYEISAWAIKGAEPIASKGRSYAERVELEAMISLSAALLGSNATIRKVKSTIAKDLGLKGRARSLTDDLDFSKIADLDQKKDKEFEAIVVAWSCLPL